MSVSSSRRLVPWDVWNKASRRLYGKPVEGFDSVSEASSDVRFQIAIQDAMSQVEASTPDGLVECFKQVGGRLLVVGKGDADTVFLKLCWECKWLEKAHNPDCVWAAFLEVVNR